MTALTVWLASATSQINSSALKACSSGACNTGTSLAGVFAGIANALIFLVGAISVVMIIVGGLRYVISNGDSKQVAAAKDTILYAVIGIIVAIASYAIVHFVTNAL